MSLALKLADLIAVLGYDHKDHEQRLDALEVLDPVVRVSRAGTLALANATETQVPFDTEAEDDWGFHSNVTNSHRLTVPAGAGGLYLADYEGWYASNAVAARYTRIYRRNAANVIQETISDIRNGSAGGVGTIVHLCAPLRLVAGEIVDVTMYQNAGAGVTLTSPANTIRFALYKINK